MRKASDTRPLSLKNCDNKAIVQANVLVLAPQFKQIVHKSQNGFVPGCNFLNNLVEIDAVARISSCKYAGASDQVRSLAKNFPIIAANDFGAAFPSVSHEWLWMVLRHRGLPPRFIRFFQAIYRQAAAVVFDKGTLRVHL